MSGRIIKAATANELYRKALQETVLYGDVVSPRGKGTRELLGVTLVLEDANHNVISNPSRKLNYSFAVAEWLWIMTGCSLEDAIMPFNANLSIAHDPNGIAFAGAYGPKWIQQMDYVLSTLRADPSSRQAVVNIWNDRPRQSNDTPCTLDWQFLIRGGKLHMHARMRSNDVWLGTPYDLFNFTQIQRWVAHQLEIDVGQYVHFVSSFHVYDAHVAVAENAALDDRIEHIIEKQQPFYRTPPLAMLQRILLACARSYEFFKDGVTDQRAELADALGETLMEYGEEWRCVPYLLLRVAPNFHATTVLHELAKRNHKTV